MAGHPSNIHVRVSLAEAAEAIPFLAQHRLGIEVVIGAGDCDRGLGGITGSLARHFAAEGIPVSVHAPFLDLSPGSVDELIREVSRDRLTCAAAAAAEFSPTHVTVHSGFDRWRNGRDIEGWIERSLPVWQKVAAALPERVPLVFENVFEEHPNNLVGLLGKLPEECFGFCFDVGHCNLFSTVTVDLWLRTLGDRLMALHLHDNGGLNDDHRPIGEGMINFAPLLGIIGRDQVVSVLEHGSREETLRSLQELGNLLQAMGDRAGG